MNNPNTELTLISISKAAQLLGIGKTSLANLIAQGKIGFIVVSQRRKIPYSELQRFITESTYYNSTITNPPIWSDDKSVSDQSKNIELNSTELFDQLKGEILNG